MHKKGGGLRRGAQSRGTPPPLPMHPWGTGPPGSASGVSLDLGFVELRRATTSSPAVSNQLKRRRVFAGNANLYKKDATSGGTAAAVGLDGGVGESLDDRLDGCVPPQQGINGTSAVALRMPPVLWGRLQRDGQESCDFPIVAGSAHVKMVAKKKTPCSSHPMRSEQFFLSTPPPKFRPPVTPHCPKHASKVVLHRRDRGGGVGAESVPGHSLFGHCLHGSAGARRAQDPTHPALFNPHQRPARPRRPLRVPDAHWLSVQDQAQEQAYPCPRPRPRPRPRPPAGPTC